MKNKTADLLGDNSELIKHLINKLSIFAAIIPVVCNKEETLELKTKAHSLKKSLCDILIKEKILNDVKKEI